VTCSAPRMVIFLAGGLGAAVTLGFFALVDGSVDVQADLGGEGWVVLTAATARNYALEQEGEALSVYTRYLIEGLKTGAAAQAGQEYVSVRQLHHYVRGKVETAAPTMEPAIFNRYEGEDIWLARAVINPETTYRQKVQSKIRRGRIGPAGRQFLETWQGRLGIAPERAQQIEQEVLKPFVERQRHLERYAETLEEEMAEEFPLSPEAIQDLKDLQRLWNLRDNDVEPLMREALRQREPNPEQLLTQMLAPATPQVPIAQAQSTDSPKAPAWAKIWGITAQSYPFETVRVNERGQIVERLPGEAEYFVENLGDGVTLEMVYVPGDEFLMGSPEGEAKSYGDERPQHRVTVSAFCMGKFVITQAQYAAITSKSPSHFEGENRPVEQVSWQEAIAFCKTLTSRTGRLYRLPSEAEWEYACRAGTQTHFYFGPTLTSDIANYDGTKLFDQGPTGEYREQTTEVGQFPPNAFGLHDLHGNVWEWCDDTWHDNYKNAPADGTAWTRNGTGDKRIRRGGSRLSSPWDCRSAYRYRTSLDCRYFNVGFRVVCSPPRTS
ncbi:MAG: formylglycine-generating enzyme family protein, partial [Cyanobacteria bacterium P01_D01_bin.115]